MHEGSVIIDIQGDGKELWRSKKIADASLSGFDVDIKNVKELSLKVKDAANGTISDWGVWAEPILER